MLHHSKLGLSMSALGQKQTSAHVHVMSALPPIADIAGQRSDHSNWEAHWKRQASVDPRSGAGSAFGVTPPLDLATTIWPNDLSGERHMHAYTTARFIGGQRMGQALSKEASERARIIDREGREVSNATLWASGGI
jgi:hypothetical protein